MVVHKICLVLYTYSIKKSLQFYINETNLFIFDMDLGMNQVRIKSNFNESLYILISEVRNKKSINTLEIYTKNIEKEFEKMQKINFKSDAKIISDNGNLFEYPIGKSFTIEDPFGNQIILIESDYL